jgi:hypothetical protein
MKSGFYLFALLFTFTTLTSCKKEKQPDPNQKYVGTWKGTCIVTMYKEYQNSFPVLFHDTLDVSRTVYQKDEGIFFNQIMGEDTLKAQMLDLTCQGLPLHYHIIFESTVNNIYTRFGGIGTESAGITNERGDGTAITESGITGDYLMELFKVK